MKPIRWTPFKIAGTLSFLSLAAAWVPFAGAQVAVPPEPQQAPVYVKDAHPPKDVVDLDLLTWPELYKEIHEEGKTTVLIFNGGLNSVARRTSPADTR